MARIDSFLRLVVEQRASDLHLCAGAPPIVRLSGELVPLPFRTLSDLEARRRIPDIDELDLPRAVRNFTRLANGLVLVTGPTGSGKTTTLAAIIHEINRSYARHIVTIEDPIEFIHDPIQSLVTHREVGTHAETFAGALRAALRE